MIDSKDGSFWMDTYVVPQGRGTSVRTLRGKTEQSNGEAATHGEVYGWVGEQLRHAAPSGTKSTTVKLTQGRGGAIHSGNYSGEAKVQVTWKLETLK